MTPLFVVKSKLWFSSIQLYSKVDCLLGRSPFSLTEPKVPTETCEGSKVNSADTFSPSYHLSHMANHFGLLFTSWVLLQFSLSGLELTINIERYNLCITPTSEPSSTSFKNFSEYNAAMFWLLFLPPLSLPSFTFVSGMSVHHGAHAHLREGRVTTTDSIWLHFPHFRHIPANTTLSQPLHRLYNVFSSG